MNNEEKILQMLESLTGKVGQLTEDMSELKADVSGLKADVSGLRTDVDLLKEDQAAMQETLTRVAVTQENFVLPRLQVLTEGQVALRETLASKKDTEKRLKVLESDMSVIKTVVRTHSGQLAALEKAQ